MVTLDLAYYAKTTRVKNLVVRGEPQEVRRLARIEGARVHDACVSFAPNPHLVPRIRTLLPALTLTEPCHLWLQQERAVYKRAEELHRLDDALSELSNLWRYQRVGVLWLKERERTILGDDMGLGKTPTALLAAKQCGASSILVVTLATAKTQWQEEMARWLGVSATVVDGTAEERASLIRQHDPYTILHYEILREALATPTKEKVVRGRRITVPGHAALYPELLTVHYDVVIFDEAQKLQNEHAQQSKAAARLARKMQYVFLLTGTPLWNRPDSFWHLLHLVQPEQFPSKWAFISRYCETETTVYGTKVTGVRQDTKEELHRIILPHLLRREQEQVRADLPPKIATTLTYDLSAEQQHLYEQITQDFVLPAQPPKHYANVAATLTDLRFLCSAPSLLGLALGTPKEQMLDELLERIFAEKERKVTIFCWHKRVVAYLAERLRKTYRVLTATGDDAGSTRSAIVRKQFKEGDAHLLIGTIASIGTALNIEFSDTAIFYEMDWTPANNNQAAKRLHRFTTTHTVFLYYLVARTSIERHVYNTHHEKSDLADEVLALHEITRRVAQERISPAAKNSPQNLLTGTIQ